MAPRAEFYLSDLAAPVRKTLGHNAAFCLRKTGKDNLFEVICDNQRHNSTLVVLPYKKNPKQTQTEI